MKNFIVVFIAVMLANLCTVVLYESYRSQTLQSPPRSIEQQPAEAPEEINPIIEETARQTAQQAKQNQRQAELISSAEQLCKYWSKEYDKEPTGLNEALRDKACARHKKLLSATPSAE